MTIRQKNATCGGTVHDKALDQLACSPLAALVLIGIEGEIDGAFAFAQLAELVLVELCTQRAGHVMESSLPQGNIVEQPFDQDHLGAVTNLFPCIQAALTAGQEAVGEGSADAAAVEVDNMLVLPQRKHDALTESVRAASVDEADPSQQIERMPLRHEVTAQHPAGSVTDIEFPDQIWIMPSAPVESVHHTGEISAADLTESTLFDYLRFQSSRQPPPSATTINDRVACADRAIRNQFPDAPCQVAHGFHQPYLHRRPMGLGRPRFELSRLRIREPRLNIVPLSVDEVARFWSSFRNARDLAIVGLMLMQGLRSAEVMALNRDDVLFSEGQLRVPGKGNKLRLLPLAPETMQLIDHYLRVERPDPCSAALFVVLKGPARGQRMTPAGLRSLFRHHRRTTGVQLANPHRFRHTFASDMVRAGISLPALMQLMGHADIETTMHYVKISPQDIYLQYARAAAQCIHPQPRIS